MKPHQTPSADATLAAAKNRDISNTPDIETSSEDYERRFRGEVGAYFLERQRQLVMRLLSKALPQPGTIIEVGGGHAQLTPALLALGHHVTVQGSAESCARKLPGLGGANANTPEFLCGPILPLPLANQSYDAAIAIRLVAHVPDTAALVRQLTRVAKHSVIIDFAPWESFNVLSPLTFALKKRVEKNTRHFLLHRRAQIRGYFAAEGFSHVEFAPQFFFPMGIHRAIGRAGVSKSLEGFSQACGFTQIFGSPVIALALRK